MASLELDMMEYATPEAAQAAYVTNAVNTIIQQETTANDADTLGNSSGVEYRLGEKLVLTSLTTISQVKLTFVANLGSPSGNVTCRIETDNAGVPSGTLAHANATLTISVTPSAENTWSFTNFVLPTGTYWVVWTCDNQSTNNAWQSSINYGIAGGRGARSANGVWGVLTERNRTCKIYILPLQSHSEATIKTQGSYALKGIAAITDSLNKTLTRTATIGDLTDVKTLQFDFKSNRTGSNVKIGLVNTQATTEITPNVITADTFSTYTWDISSVPNANKNAITSIVITQVNADAPTTWYLDNFKIAQAIDVFGWIT